MSDEACATFWEDIMLGTVRALKDARASMIVITTRVSTKLKPPCCAFRFVKFVIGTRVETDLLFMEYSNAIVNANNRIFR